jgi:hypothetical protein
MTRHTDSLISRRRILAYSVVAGAAAAGAPALAACTPSITSSNTPQPGPAPQPNTGKPPDVLPEPKPIPGGSTLPDGSLIHVFAPGTPGVTLPFTKVPLEGLDVEPRVMTDHNGFAALAYHVGTATGSDGKTYDLETDMRVMHGSYVAADGTRRDSGLFVFV